jgi:hypothetical protein
MGRSLKIDPLKLDEWIRQQTKMPMPRKKLGRNGIGGRMMTNRFGNGGIDRNEFGQMERFHCIANHGGRGHDTETHLINMQRVVPRKKVPYSAQVHGRHFGKIKDDVAAGSLLSLLNKFFKSQGLKGIQVSGKSQYSSGRVVGTIEVLHERFIGNKEERVKIFFWKKTNHGWKERAYLILPNWMIASNNKLSCRCLRYDLDYLWLVK